jgi:hypothetical protein
MFLFAGSANVWATLRVSESLAGRAERVPLWSDGRIAGVECKLGATPNARDFAALAHLRDKLGKRFTASVLVHTGPETLPFGERLWAVPVSALWAPAP